MEPAVNRIFLRVFSAFSADVSVVYTLEVVRASTTSTTTTSITTTFVARSIVSGELSIIVSDCMALSTDEVARRDLERGLGASLALPARQVEITDVSAVSLSDDAACEAVLRKFIAEDAERAERLLHRANELVTEARNSHHLWTMDVNGLDGTSFQLPVNETATVASTASSMRRETRRECIRLLARCTGTVRMEGSQRRVQSQAELVYEISLGGDANVSEELQSALDAGSSNLQLAVTSIGPVDQREGVTSTVTRTMTGTSTSRSSSSTTASFTSTSFTATSSMTLTVTQTTSTSTSRSTSSSTQSTSSSSTSTSSLTTTGGSTRLSAQRRARCR
eukprot:g26985.t2